MGRSEGWTQSEVMRPAPTRNPVASRARHMNPFSWINTSPSSAELHPEPTLRHGPSQNSWLVLTELLGMDEVWLRASSGPWCGHKQILHVTWGWTHLKGLLLWTSLRKLDEKRPQKRVFLLLSKTLSFLSKPTATNTKIYHSSERSFISEYFKMFRHVLTFISHYYYYFHLWSLNWIKLDLVLVLDTKDGQIWF